jgi:UDPglucose 6-dehydrogenase|tara:strand:+ start:5104 stop:5901 length:798 start_codon:yes stop_codon:yes gene_type:complete
MNIGIVGLGIVGRAIEYGFEKLGHTLKVHDIILDTSLSDVLDTEICYLCVPTPSDDEGGCDASIVEDVVRQLEKLDYQGVVAIKSTVIPGTTARLQEKFPGLTICFVPEFLRERCAQVDFTERHDLCIIGTDSESVYEKIRLSHGKYPRNIKQLSVTEAELAKYFNNIFNATLVTFANSFFEVCNSLDADYTLIKDCLTHIDHIPDKYLDCNDAFRGFGGMCLPKDTRAMNHFCRSKGLFVNFFDLLIKENSKYETTVFGGMRKE